MYFQATGKDDGRATLNLLLACEHEFKLLVPSGWVLNLTKFEDVLCTKRNGVQRLMVILVGHYQCKLATIENENNFYQLYALFMKF